MERDENLQLRDFPTLNHVVGWVREQDRCAGSRGGGARGGPCGCHRCGARSAAPAAVEDPIDGGGDRGWSAEMTGYPPELLDPDLDLEADLGVDTVKQAEVFAAVREEYGLERDENLQLRDFPTLNHVVGWVRERTGAPAPAAAAPGGPCGCHRCGPALRLRLRWRTRSWWR